MIIIVQEWECEYMGLYDPFYTKGQFLGAIDSWHGITTISQKKDLRLSCPPPGPLLSKFILLSDVIGNGATRSSWGMTVCLDE